MRRFFIAALALAVCACSSENLREEKATGRSKAGGVPGSFQSDEPIIGCYHDNTSDATWGGGMDVCIAVDPNNANHGYGFFVGTSAYSGCWKNGDIVWDNLTFDYEDFDLSWRYNGNHWHGGNHTGCTYNSETTTLHLYPPNVGNDMLET